MKLDLSFGSIPGPNKFARRLFSIGTMNMEKAMLATFVVVFVAAVLILRAAPLSTNDVPAPQAGELEGREYQADWRMHTQLAFDELKERLNLSPIQMSAWDTWSAGVINDRQRLEHKDIEREVRSVIGNDPSESTTPERMARGIELMQAETAAMEKHLSQLEAAKTRTSTFYAVLDANQQSIFDLFWREKARKVSGRDLGGKLSGYRNRSPMT